MDKDEILSEIRKLIVSRQDGKTVFKPGHTYIPASGTTLDGDDISYLCSAAMDGWLTSGPRTQQFERDFARFFGTRECVLTNSGSSANLLAVSAMGLQPGDEVITAAAGFPTTVNPIIQCGGVPVFVDSELETYNAKMETLHQAISPKTKGLILAHTLGNPYDLAFVKEFCDYHKIWWIEDCCDALGAKWDGIDVGSLCDLSTCSFFPAHHITMGEGGAVMGGAKHRKALESYRDWGRDCWCIPGKENTCGKRFEWSLGALPQGYDHKYIYSKIGYNLKTTELQAALGLAQLKKLPLFIERRKENARRLINGLHDLPWLKTASYTDQATWFGVPIRITETSTLSRMQTVQALEKSGIGTRMLFGGNLTKQPAYMSIPIRISGNLSGADQIMDNVFWIGCHQNVTDEMIDYMLEVFHGLQ